MAKKATGPKRDFSLDKLIKIFEKYEKKIVRDDDKILRPKDVFWTDLKTKYKIPAKEKNIYTDAWKWHKNLKGKDSEKNNDFDDSLEEEIELDSSKDSMKDSSFTDDDKNCDKSDIKFSIILTSELWKLIEPVPRSYHRRSNKRNKSGVRVYSVLKPGAWSSVIIEQIAQHPKNIICNWAFKNARVSSNGKYYVFITANCINCQSKLFITLKTKPADNVEVKFTCIVKDFDESRHTESDKKVKVCGSQAQLLAASKKSAIALHRQLAAKSGEMFEQPKGRVPSANAIRNLQSRHRAKARLSPDTFTALLYLQASKKYVETIHMVSISPFVVIYGSNNQFRLFKMYEKKNALTKINCDSTGSVLRKIGMYIINSEFSIPKTCM